MNVKITYSVPFDEVPKRVDDLIFEAASQMTSLGVKVSSKEDNLINKLTTIDEVRKKLASIDFLLEDCYSILASYNKALASMHGTQNDQQISSGGSSDDSTKSNIV